MAINPAFTLKPENATSIADICRRLDGLPLAIELAAARIGVLSAEEIASALDDRFALLSGGLRSLWGRHQTLAEALDWSYELLSAQEQAMLRRLGTFAGPAGFEAVTAVCAWGDLTPEAVLDLLAALVSKSLVFATTATAPARYRLLETVRAYATQRLRDGEEATGDGEEARETGARHVAFYREFAEAAETYLTGPDQLAWLERVDAEYDNLRVALGRALVLPASHEAPRLAASLTLYWRLRGQYSEGLRWLRAALGNGAGLGTALRAKVLWGEGFLSLMSSDMPGAEGSLLESADLYHDLGDVRGQGRATLLRANCCCSAGEYASALELLYDALSLARIDEDAWCVTHALALAGRAYAELGDASAARASLDEGLSVARAQQNPQGLRIVLTILGKLELAERRYRRAEQLLGEALELNRQLGDLHGTSSALLSLGGAMMARGEPSKARQLLEQGMEADKAAGDVSSGWSHFLLGRLALEEGDFPNARLRFEGARQAISPASTERAGGYLDGCLVVAQGELAIAEGDLGCARALLEQAVEGAEQAEDWRVRAAALGALGRLERAEGRGGQAEALQSQALEIWHRLRDRPGVIGCLEALGALALDAADAQRAARLLGAADSLRGSWEYSGIQRQADEYAANVARATRFLGENDFEIAWKEGVALSPGDAVAYALRGRDRGAKRPNRGWESLTNAEQEVARLVAQNLTNAQIGARLFVSRETVKSRVTSVFQKLGINSRLELATEVVRREVTAGLR